MPDRDYVVVRPAESSGLPPRISVCVANYQGEHLLEECLESILAQACDAPFEILVHDDASTDASLALLRDRYPGILRLESSSNAGFCIANHRMVEHARGEFVLLFNNDAALMAGAMQALLDLPARKVIATLPQFDWQDGALVDRGHRLDLTYFNVPNRDVEARDLAGVAGACLWMRREDWHRLGGFPTFFGSLAEDTALCCVARLWGFEIHVAESSGYRHRQGASFGGAKVSGGRLETTWRRRALSERNRLMTLLACTPAKLLVAWLPFFVASLVAETLVLSIFARNLRPWREICRPALRDAVHLRATWGDWRRRVQAGRVIGAAAYARAFQWWPRKLALFLRHGRPRIR